MNKKRRFYLPLLLLLGCSALWAQPSIARRWNEELLNAIRNGLARPPVTARNLFHCSIAMYDAWAAYDSTARPYLLGNTFAGITYPFTGVPAPANVAAARSEAISYAMYRLIYARYFDSPGFPVTLTRINLLMAEQGFNVGFTSTDYTNGPPAALGNYIAESILNMGFSDGSNELNSYEPFIYFPANPPMEITLPGNPNMVHHNQWQPLNVPGALDQNGNPIPANQRFQMPEWGRVRPFAMDDADKTSYDRFGFEYPVYHDPGPPPIWSLTDPFDSASIEFKWSNALVSAWAAHHNPYDGVWWDISPGSIGNVTSYPQTLAEQRNFYDFENGGDTGQGHPLNPKTGQPYPPNMVPRGDYTRVLSQFWADGPFSETPPGHWYVIWNAVNDHPQQERRFAGKGPLLDTLEWEVKTYFALGGALHDAAIAAWGVKGWYDGGRPITALRYMAGLGQSTDPGLPSYHPGGVELIPGYIELVLEGDPLAGPNNEQVGKIKMYTWRGFDFISNPQTSIAGVGWILAENWMPYQRQTFVTPPFAGYVSGHSTYSRAAAEVLTALTGDPYFPGGVGEFHIAANSQFLFFEQGPSVDVTLQWATYRDASDQTSLSRIWGGIHPGFDDIPGRKIGAICGIDAFHLAKTYFYADQDQDGFFSYEDCDDNNPDIHPNATELCDGIDNNCNEVVDDNALTSAYYADADNDGFGDAAVRVDTCTLSGLTGFVINAEDCDDNNPDIHPNATEVCDGIDNNCNQLQDDGLPIYLFYADSDGDGYGDPNLAVSTCQTSAPGGFVSDTTDCDDTDPLVFPNAAEVQDGKDNNCNGLIDEVSDVKDLLWSQLRLYPNPASDFLYIEHPGIALEEIRLFDHTGRIALARTLYGTDNSTGLDLGGQANGLYRLELTGAGLRRIYKIVVLRP